MPDPIVNPRDIAALKRRDDVFRAIAARFGDPPNWKRRPGFVSLCRIILEQQVSLESAKAHFARLRAFLPSFTPRAILELSDDQMRSCQVSRQKAGYLRALADAIAEKRLSLGELGRLDPDSARERLMEIKGVGRWTADIYLMFCLRSKDVFPLGDLAVMSAALELRPGGSRSDIERLSERWSPYRSLAAYYLWHYYLSSRGRAT
jgi:DNA-3-methyladenine glycosylase II